MAEQGKKVKLTITVTGDNPLDAAMAAGEALRLAEQGYTWGQGNSGDAKFKLSVQEL